MDWPTTVESKILHIRINFHQDFLHNCQPVPEPGPLETFS